MKAALFFGINLDFNPTINNQLKGMAALYKWDPGLKKYLYFFNISQLKAVEELTGLTIDIDNYTPSYKKQEVDLDNWKGIDDLTVIELPKTYEVITHQKVEDSDDERSFKIVESRREIDKEIVARIWKEVIAHMPLNKKIKTRTVAENICKEFNIDRFDKASGKFSFESFFGHRPDYRLYFYYPIKILAWQGKVRHHKSGYVERII